MATVYTKQFNWLPQTSAWGSVQSWRAKHRAHQNAADATFAATAETFSAATANLAFGMSEIAARRAAARVAVEAQAKIASVSKSV